MSFLAKNFLITGGAGFIGSHFTIKACNLGHKVVVLDKLTYAGNMANLAAIQGKTNFKFVKGDITNPDVVLEIFNKDQIDYVINFAAESHVDNSISAPESFIQTNIVGTFNLLNCSLRYWKNLTDNKKSEFRFLHVSTDEVYGSLALDDSKFNEKNPYRPNSPYSASKAASDHLVRAWNKTYNLPTITTNCSNNFGPHQHKEKLIPVVIASALSKKQIPIYGNGRNIRDWIYVEDHVDGIYLALTEGKIGETYCFGGDCEKENIDLAKEICQILDNLQPKADGSSYQKQITFVNDRLGHDERYAVSNAKVAKELGYKVSKSFNQRLQQTVEWYLSSNLLKL